MITVKAVCINRGTKSEHYVLRSSEGFVLHSAPNNWKTEAGALRWARAHGYGIQGEKPRDEKKADAAKQKKRHTEYAPGVVIDGCSWTEKKDGNLMGTVTYNWRDVRAYRTKQAAERRAALIASRFPKSKKAVPYVTAITVEG